MGNRIDEIKKMLKTDPNDSFLTYALALEHEKSGDSKEAIRIIEELNRQDPEYIGSYYKLGQLYENNKKLDKAISVYRSGIKLADKKKDFKAKGELEEALWLIEEE